MTIYDYPPPVYEKAKELWGVDFDRGVVMTYGEDIYTKGHLTDDLLEHEGQHIIQQRNYSGGKDAWWERYFTDSEFRLEQEAECYKLQLAFLIQKHGISDRQTTFNLSKALAGQLSSPMYGSMVDILTAINLIKPDKR